MNSFDLDVANIGSYQIGVLLSYGLLGVTTTQTYIYFSRFADDSRKLKALVAFVWALQGFLGFRIHAFSKKLFIPAFVWIMAVLRLAGSTIFLLLPLTPDVNYYINGPKSELLSTSAWYIGVANDLLITVTLVFLLRRQMPDVPKRTVALVDKIIIWSMGTGALTSALGIMELICFVKFKRNWTWIAVCTIEARVFANSFLASLNGRTTLRAMSDAPLSFAIPSMESSNSTRQNVSDSVWCSG